MAMSNEMDSMSEKLKSELETFRSNLGISTVGVLEILVFDDVVKLLNTVPIQTLKTRLQLGLVYKVFNDDDLNATHTRLDHTVGVVAKCIVVCDLINSNTNDKSLQLSEIDVRELIVAAALHDCGHLPVSHASERAYFTVKGLKKGISHEERIIPLIVNRNAYFDDLRSTVLSWSGFSDISFYRIVSIICPKVTEEYEETIPGFLRPKKAIQQLLVSDIDMDRLDYVVRDAQNLKYCAVTLIEDKIINYVKGLTLFKYKSLKYSTGEVNDDALFKNKEENVELCLHKNYIENVFYLLVSRVLLYKFVYFSSEVRSFEAVLTYLVGTLIENKIALQPLKLIAMSDTEFIDQYLEELVSFIDSDTNISTHLIEKYINVLRNEKVQRFKLLKSIYSEDIINPRLKDEFEKNINNRSYIDNLKNYLNYAAEKEKKNKKEKKDYHMERSDLLFDVFNLKTGGGDLLIKENDHQFYTLKKTMNGSNMHRLCSETRLDVYGKSDLNEGKKTFIKEKIDKFFKTI